VSARQPATEKCQNCDEAIWYDNQRGWLHKDSNMRMCGGGNCSARPRKKVRNL
jgi:hypothetical protein